MAGRRGILYELNWAGPAGLFELRYDTILILDRVKKPMGLRVRVLRSQTHAREPDGSNFLPISRPAGREFVPNPCPNGVKTRRVSGFGYPLPTLCETGKKKLPK